MPAGRQSTRSVPLAILAVLLLQCTNSIWAHIFMMEPPALGSEKSSAPRDYSITNPIKGIDAYPCKGAIKTMPDGISRTPYNAGDDITITMSGSATHGGGSCQIALSYDNGVTWGVIHSFIGGCLADSMSLGFKMPPSTPAGETVMLSWSWLNKIGNREFYQNCAPITVASGSKSMEVPAAFKANLGDDECATVEGVESVFPNPGEFVTYGGPYKATPPSPGDGLTGCSDSGTVTLSSNGSPARAKAPAQNAFAKQDAPEETPEATSESTPAQTSTAIADIATSANNGKIRVQGSARVKKKGHKNKLTADTRVKGPGDSKSPTSAQADTAALAKAPGDADASAVQGSPDSVASPTAGQSNGAASGPVQAGGACTGVIGCSSDGKSFFMCGATGWISMGSVAAGTTCKDGAIGHADAQ